MVGVGDCDPNPQQDALATLPVGNIFALAPAGCGKTEALARRAHGLILGGGVRPPRKVLALTFSNKARDNLAARMATIVGRNWRWRVSVTNFHGLATRILRAHARVINLSSSFVLPNEPWRRRIQRDLGIRFDNSDAFEAALRVAKDGPVDDNEVMKRLEAAGNYAALEYERRLQAESRLDYDDLLRHLARLLQVDAVRDLYRSHFGAVLVDEVQDLSYLQFQIVRGVGGDGVTYAGDLAQGIYSFNGADPQRVFAGINALAPVVVQFNSSYRSSPRVLNSVNALARLMGATELTSACPRRWPDGGVIIYLERADTEMEAQAILRLLPTLQAQRPGGSIGVLCRRNMRLGDFRAGLTAADVAFEDWTMPTHIPQVAALLKRHVREAVAGTASPAEALVALEAMCRSSLDPGDAVTHDQLHAACADLRDFVESGLTLLDAVARCRSGARPDEPVGPGIHLLNGHKGKGQEFDWVIVMGLEDGQIPDFRNVGDPEELRVLHVMISRARYGLILTYARNVMTRVGLRPTRPSPWLQVLRSTATNEDVA